MVRLRRSRTDRGPISTVGLLVRFTAAGLIVLLSLAALIAVVARQAGVEQARESARQVAFVTALMRCAGTEPNGQESELDFRLTIGLCKIEDRWIVTHEHHSIPAS